MDIKQNILDKVNEWLTPVFDNDTQEAIKEMMTTSPKNLEESFWKSKAAKFLQKFRVWNWRYARYHGSWNQPY